MTVSIKDLPNVPTIFPGACAIDDRGELSFINGFPLEKFKRFYTVSNHSERFIRAWHGHMVESKVFFVLKGSVLACSVKMTDKSSPSKSEMVERKVLSEKNPAGYFIPAGYANGFMSLSKDAQLLVFSNTTLEESQNDDYRFPFNYWNPWEVEPR
jgi:dTDP-4-dehydrorhamnose 3,5-epimerase